MTAGKHARPTTLQDVAKVRRMFREQHNVELPFQPVAQQMGYLPELRPGAPTANLKPAQL